MLGAFMIVKLSYSSGKYADYTNLCIWGKLFNVQHTLDDGVCYVHRVVLSNVICPCGKDDLSGVCWNAAIFYSPGYIFNTIPPDTMVSPPIKIVFVDAMMLWST